MEFSIRTVVDVSHVDASWGRALFLVLVSPSAAVSPQPEAQRGGRTLASHAASLPPRSKRTRTLRHLVLLTAEALPQGGSWTPPLWDAATGSSRREQGDEGASRSEGAETCRC